MHEKYEENKKDYWVENDEFIADLKEITKGYYMKDIYVSREIYADKDYKKENKRMI